MMGFCPDCHKLTVTVWGKRKWCLFIYVCVTLNTLYIFINKFYGMTLYWLHICLLMLSYLSILNINTNINNTIWAITMYNTVCWLCMFYLWSTDHMYSHCHFCHHGRTNWGIITTNIKITQLTAANYQNTW